MHWMTSIEIKGANFEEREDFMKMLKGKSIDSRPVFSPLSSLPMFEKRNNNHVAYRIGSSAINLPSGHNLKIEEIEYIVKTINMET